MIQVELPIIFGKANFKSKVNKYVKHYVKTVSVNLVCLVINSHAVIVLKL